MGNNGFYYYPWFKLTSRTCRWYSCQLHQQLMIIGAWFPHFLRILAPLIDCSALQVSGRTNLAEPRACDISLCIRWCIITTFLVRGLSGQDQAGVRAGVAFAEFLRFLPVTGAPNLEISVGEGSCMLSFVAGGLAPAPDLSGPMHCFEVVAVLPDQFLLSCASTLQTWRSCWAPKARLCHAPFTLFHTFLVHWFTGVRANLPEMSEESFMS